MVELEGNSRRHRLIHVARGSNLLIVVHVWSRTNLAAVATTWGMSINCREKDNTDEALVDSRIKQRYSCPEYSVSVPSNLRSLSNSASRGSLSLHHNRPMGCSLWESQHET